MTQLAARCTITRREETMTDHVTDHEYVFAVDNFRVHATGKCTTESWNKMVVALTKLLTGPKP